MSDHLHYLADDLDDDLYNNGPDYLFARHVCGSRTIPGCGHVASECEPFPIDNW